MKLTTGIVAVAMMAGVAFGQSPDAIDNARSTVKALQQQQASGTTAAKPAPGAPAPAVKAAVIPGAKTAVPAAKPVAKAVAQPISASANNKLERVNVVPGSNDIQIEISSSQAVTPRVSKMSSPARVVVALPETVVASAQNKIAVGSGGVKGVRIGMDGKTPPTTSVVVDLEKPMAFEVTPGPAGKLVLILHTQNAGSTVAKNVPAPATKAPVAAVKPAAAPKVAAAKAPVTKPVAAPKVADAKAPAAKPVTAAAKQDPKQQAKTTVVAAKPAPVVSAPVKAAEVPKPKPEEKKWAMNGNRDPFFSPVVQQNGSGCSTGKKCLEIGAINVRGVVKSDAGFIAVVTNNLNKAYFLRENDPVFNGYVVKITGDSVTFQETVQDKLGKSFTREVVKRIITPAV
ncbi:MAG: AMIN domain-containing protein [Candidatus Sulfotelmatobacter sp.]